MEFENRIANHINRRKIKIISQTPTEIIADIERADENVSNTGTPINANTFARLENLVNEALETLATSSGTTVKVNNTPQATLNFTSDPQAQINDKLNATAQAVDSAKLGGKIESQLSVSNANTCSTSVNLTGNQTINGIKNFLNALQQNGYPVETIVQKSLGQNGYIKYSSGLIIQWGRLNKTGLNASLTFPVAFSNATSWALQFTCEWEYDNLGNRNPWIRSKSSSGCVLRSGDYATDFYIRWLAIGY